MNIYNRLAPLEPLLIGPWRWAMYAAIAAPIAVVLWVMFGRRWKPDGVLRCSHCQHVFDPETRFDGAAVTAGVRCSECGSVTRSEQAALRRGNRRWIIAASLASALLIALPLMVWHSVPVFIARTLMPRWVTEGRAEFPNGLTIVYEVDPVQEWFDMEANSAAGAWRGNFEDLAEISDAEANDGWNSRTIYVWPKRRRLRAWTDASQPRVTGHLDHFVFGVEGWSPTADQCMPPIGSPGFGGDVTGDGVGDVIVGEVNDGSGGGTSWGMITVPQDAPDEHGGLAITGIGVGMFQRDTANGGWIFMSVCHGFRYGMTPGAFCNDPLIACTWNAERHAWMPNVERMRRDPDRKTLAQHAAAALDHYRQCLADAGDMTAGSAVNDFTGEPAGDGDPAAAALEALRNGRAGMGDFLPCPAMIGSLSAGVLELLTSGYGAEWEEWVRLAWPTEATASFRDRFIADTRRTIETCECAKSLRELNGFPEARPAVGATPRGSDYKR